MDVVYQLPYPPSVNHYYANGRNGQRRLSERGRAYRELAVAAIRRRGLPTIARRAEVWIDLFPPDRRDRDIDNPIKPVLDALQHGGAVANDKLFRTAHIKIHDHDDESPEGGAALVRIHELEGGDSGSNASRTDRRTRSGY